MSYLIKEQNIQEDNLLHIQKILSRTKCFMISHLSAQPGVYENFTQANTFVSSMNGRTFQHIQIYWIITFQKLGVKIKLIPSSLKSLGIDLIIKSQRLYVDLSQLLSIQNKKLKNKYKIFINGAGHICIESYIGYQQIQNPKNLDYILKMITFEMKNILDDKLKFLGPYISVFKSIQSEELSQKSSIAEKISNFLILNQIYREHRYLAYQENSITDTTIFNKLNTFGQKDFNTVQNILIKKSEQRKKLQQYLNLIFLKNSIEENNLQKKINQLKNIHYEFARQKQKKSVTQMTFRNVYGVTDIQKISKQNQLNSNGSHSSLSIASYHFKLVNTINAYFKEPKQTKGLRFQKKRSFESFENESLHQQQTYLIKKVCRDKQHTASFNSFKNQIQFICYIRDRFCKYISTYYWDTSKQKTNTEEIYMDYYPQNIFEFIMKTHQSEQIISFQNKIELLYQILICLNFLSQNYVCHRDVKLQNIMISVSRDIKMIDFGSCAPIFGRPQFFVRQKRLLGTDSYYYPYQQCSESIKKAYKIAQYEQHMLFDAYSFGTIIQRIIGKQDFTIQKSPTIRVEAILYYIKQKCHQIDPVNRLTYTQMLYLFQLIKQVLAFDQKNIKN